MKHLLEVVPVDCFSGPLMMEKRSINLYISILVCGNGRRPPLISCQYKIVEGVPSCNKAFNSSFPKEQRNQFETHGLCNWLG